MLGTHTYLIAAVLIGVVSSGFAFRGVDFRERPTSRMLPNAVACNAPGLMCKNCETVQSCVSTSASNTEFTATDIQTCNETSLCLNGACVTKTDPNPFCQPEYDNFVCPDYGMFPNPAYCQKFYICVPDETNPPKPTPWNCENGYAYNARTKVCDKKLINNRCIGYPVPLCKIAAQTAPLQENPSIYYVCGYNGTVLYPFINTCKNGKIYNSKWGCQ